MAKYLFHTYYPLNLKRAFLAFSVVILAGLYSCITTYDTINNRNFADTYNPGSRTMHPEYQVYMKSADEVRLYFRFFPKELSFMMLGEDSVWQANASLFYRITTTCGSTQIVDSLTKNINLKGNPRPQFVGFLPLNISSEGKYIIEVFLTDANLSKSVSNVIEYHHKPTGTAQSFMHLSQYGNPSFYPYFTPADTFRVRSDMFEREPIQVSYYKPVVKLPVAPDIPQNRQFEPESVDSSWVVPKLDTTLFSFKNEGIYLFSSPANKVGIPFGCFQNHYPYIKSAQSLLQTLGYLVNDKEMRELQLAGNDKQVLDTFWTTLTHDLDKSRELIRVYYNRVQLANYFFSDYREGWLTDRGMIFIICGSPATIRKTDEGEYWLYGKGENESTRFLFYRENHPVFGATYLLERSDLYSRMWFNAVTTWREGRVFSLNP